MYITTTFNREFDNLLKNSILEYSKGNKTAKEVIQLLADGESYVNGKPLYPDCDMTKETKQDVIETISEMSGVEEDDLWLVYDEVYDEFYKKLN